MNFKEYIPLAVRTAKPLSTKIENVGHAVLGMFTEISELSEAIENRDDINIGEECGDILWYLALLTNSLNIDLDSSHKILNEEVFNFFEEKIDVSNLEKLTVIMSRELDIVKKNVIYNKEVGEDILSDSIGWIFFSIMFILDDWELNIQDVMQKNINKLAKRYPNLYTDHDADNRNLDNERRELTGGRD